MQTGFADSEQATVTAHIHSGMATTRCPVTDGARELT